MASMNAGVLLVGFDGGAGAGTAFLRHASERRVLRGAVRRSGGPSG